MKLWHQLQTDQQHSQICGWIPVTNGMKCTHMEHLNIFIQHSNSNLTKVIKVRIAQNHSKCKVQSSIELPLEIQIQLNST